ncbi:LysR family transcriptional regulator [Paraburkholderia sp. J41]|uniref:LysR family transcriptional regulator n=1 Tax=Paraburkholderia sp. J41 TaxID=2805433 RepID=UPI002AC3226F|nr:LysR substrate-binding domain-containing protein [Paraburkholderia sp. J41]
MDRMAAMETFVAVVEAGSFSAAARRLALGQPAVSKSVAQLEDHLGARLLLRSTRGLTPTDAGQRFYEHARRAIEEADHAEQAVHESSAGLSGRLRISAAVTFSRLHVLPALKVFLDRHPNLELDVILDDRSIDLLEEGVDVALRMCSLDDSSMTARHISQSRRLVVGTPDYFAQMGVPGTPAELSRHQAIVYSLRGGGESWAFTQNGTEVAVVVRLGRCALHDRMDFWRRVVRRLAALEAGVECIEFLLQGQFVPLRRALDASGASSTVYFGKGAHLGQGVELR